MGSGMVRSLRRHGHRVPVFDVCQGVSDIAGWHNWYPENNPATDTG
jgi:hypothetical protein